LFIAVSKVQVNNISRIVLDLQVFIIKYYRDYRVIIAYK